MTSTPNWPYDGDFSTDIYPDTGGGEVPEYVVKLVATTRNDTANPTDDPDFIFAGEADGLYELEGLIFVESSNTADFKGSLRVPGDASFRMVMDGPATTVNNGIGAIARNTTVGGNLVIGTGGPGVPVAVRPAATIKMGPTAGEIAFQWAQGFQEVSDSSVLELSRMRVRKMN